MDRRKSSRGDKHSRYEAYWSDLTGSHALHPGNQFRYRAIVRELRERNLHPKDVVDCGCGDGSFVCSLRTLYPEGNFYGTDVADNVPANHPGSGIRFQRADLGCEIADELKNRFDLVICSEVIEHVADDRRVIQNLVAMAKPGATVVLTTQKGQMYPTEQYLGHLRRYRVEGCANDSAGLEQRS